MKEGLKHRWQIDAIEEGVAAIAQDGGDLFQVPLTELPQGVREGDLLNVVLSAGADGSRKIVSISIDRAATEAALEHSRAQLRPRGGARLDPGGDIVL